MSLTGLLEAIADDPQFRQVPSLASAPATEVGRAGGEGADVTAPAALRPLLAAALAGAPGQARQPGQAGEVGHAGQPGQARRFLLAVTATAREAEELSAAL